MRPVRLAVILAACALGALPTFAAAAPKSAAERAQVLQQVVDCRKITDAGERLACYDRSAQALDDAEKTGQVVVVDQAKAREIRRQSFGFALPSLSVLNLAGKGEGVNRLETTIESAREIADGRFVIHTVDGATWRQVDGDLLRTPKAGQSFVITPGALGSFFCHVDNQLGYRCKREN